ncbi:hypothetical protein MBLNU13_g01686t1 [Cladosporium sp. NU13]
MGNGDSFGMGSQNPKPSNDKSTHGYRLFPTSNQQPHLSPKTLQQQTLHRNGSFKKRRSVSLDDSSRPHGVARMPFSRPSDAPAPRLQDVPANRMKASKAEGQDRNFQSPKILSYKPKISEDASHGRSSSAPDGMRGEMRTRKPTGLAHMTNAAISSSAKAVRGLGGTWYNPHDSTIGGPSRQDSQRRYNRQDPIQEKPLPPPPPREQTLDPYHNRSHSTPLSPGPGSSFYSGARSASITGLTPLVTPSSLDPSRKSYFPLSSDAQIRQLIGFSPIEDDENEPAESHSRGKSRDLDASMIMGPSKHQEPVELPAISIQTKPADKHVANKAHHGSPETAEPVVTSQPVFAPAAPASLARPSLPSPTLSQASTAMVPAALRITGPKRSASVSATLDRRPLPMQARVRAADDVHSTQSFSNTIASRDSEVSTTLSVLSELTVQTENLHARYASLREDRQTLLTAISQGLKEQRAGPDYVNTIFDQHMSLATVCSSMDICVAKLKVVARRKDNLVKSLTTQTPQTAKKPSLSSINEQKPTPVPTSARSTPAHSSSHKTSLSTSFSLQPLKSNPVHEVSRPAPSDAMQRFRSNLDIDYDTDDSSAPRRMNIKGAKAAKILGLALEPETSPEPRSSESSQFNSIHPTHNLKANHSTTSLDRELFTRAPSPLPAPAPAPAPAPDRPLPARPSIRMKKRDHVPTPLPLRPTEKSVVEKPSHTAQRSVDDSTVSSRASTPAEDRGAETPLEECPAFDAKSPGMQTVHVYFPDSLSIVAPSIHSSTFSEIGEDELLEYYGYLR